MDSYRTVVEDDGWIASGAMIGAGGRVGRNAMVGAKAIVQGGVPAHHVAVGAPAKSVKVKPGWESAAPEPGQRPDTHETRRIEYDLPDDLQAVDEFQRRLRPPDDESQ